MTKREGNSRKMRSGTAGRSFYVRCQHCRREFKGNSDEVLKSWSQHIGPCEKKHKMKG